MKTCFVALRLEPDLAEKLRKLSGEKQNLSETIRRLIADAEKNENGEVERASRRIDLTTMTSNTEPEPSGQCREVHPNDTP